MSWDWLSGLIDATALIHGGDPVRLILIVLLAGAVWTMVSQNRQIRELNNEIRADLRKVQARMYQRMFRDDDEKLRAALEKLYENDPPT